MLADHVLYIDSEALIVDKPHGLPVDPPRNGGLSVENHLQALMLGYRSWPKPVHRLDQDTSGCLMLGRSAKAHKRLGQAFEAGLVEKRYLAILDGIPDGESGTIAMALAKTSTKEDGWRIVPAADGAKGSKPAVTAWELMATRGTLALIALRPATGRTHQLRVHAASGLSRAIVGDGVYGADHPGGLMLHASDLGLAREGKARIAAHAPFPARFAALGFTDPDAD
jgi:tRNA pseudouridine32 synthase / 23S rRNA pseudouridine746 synthase